MVCQLIQDHPRRCGENKEAQAIKVLCTGSPPQVRGKPRGGDEVDGKFRITPAGAGKTMTASAALSHLRDHPRRCGENHCTFAGVVTRTGSPPQVRGKHLGHDCNQAEGGITPAGAGKTQTAGGFRTQ